MKILFLFTRSDTISSGVFIHVRDLASSLIKDGHSVLVGVGGDGPVFQELKRHQIPCYSIKSLDNPINPLKDFEAFLEIKKLIQDFEPDFVSSHTTKAGWIARLAAAVLGIKLIYTPHGLSFADGVPKLKRIIYANLERLTINLCTYVIAVCEYDKKEMLRNKVGKEDSIKVIYNGMKGVEKELLIQPGRPPIKLVMVARFENQKDHHTLLLSLSNLKFLNWQLDFFGDGSLMESTKNTVETLGLEERINFKGTVNNLREHLQEYQIFLLITNWEGFPRSIIEAMGVGLPIVATDVGGVSEAVEHGVNGFLISRGDSTGLTDVLQGLIEDSDLRMRMSTANLEKFNKEFTYERMYFDYVELYKEIIDEI